MLSARFRGKVKGGKFASLDPLAYALKLESLEGKDIVVSIDLYKEKRSLPQNAYYHTIVVKMISEHTGETPETIHKEMKSMFLRESLPMGGIEIKSTTKLKTNEFEEYLSKIRMWASSFLSLYIPNPGEANERA